MSFHLTIALKAYPPLTLQSHNVLQSLASWSIPGPTTCMDNVETQVVEPPVAAAAVFEMTMPENTFEDEMPMLTQPDLPEPQDPEESKVQHP